MRSNVGALARNVLRLGDLQLQLLSADVREFWQHSRVAIGMLLMAALTMLASLPVLLLGIATGIHQITELSLPAAQVICGITGVLLGLLVLWWSLHQLTRAGSSLSRSQQELRDNLACLRTILHNENEGNS